MALSKPPMVVGIRQTSSAIRTGIGKLSGGINAERFQRHADEQENERQRGEQNCQRDFVRRFLTVRAFNQRNHAIEKAVAFLHRDANDNAIAQHARAAGDRAAVAAAFANHRRRFAGDGRFIDAGDSFDDIAIRRNDVARFADDEIAFLQHRRGNLFFAPVVQPARHRFLARFSQTGGLRFAAAFRHRFGEIRKQDREPKPDRQLRNETAQRRLGGKDSDGGERRAHHGHKHDRVLDHQTRVEFLESVADRRAGNVPIKERRSFLCHRFNTVLKKFSLEVEEMLNHRSERERREKIQRADQQHRAEQQNEKCAAGNRECSGAGWRNFLLH